MPLGRRDRIPGALFASGLDRLRRRFALWSEADLEAQAAELERELGESARTPAPVDTGPGAHSRVRFEGAARALLGRIARRRIELGVEAPEAAGADLARRVRRASLYDGLAGEALLLAAVPRGWRRAASSTRPRGLARAGFDRAVAALATAQESAPLGVMQGVGSWLWTLAWLERLAPGDREGGRSPRGSSARSAQRLAADQRLDLEGGLAGLVLGLLAAPRRRAGDARVLARRARRGRPAAGARRGAERWPRLARRDRPAARRLRARRLRDRARRSPRSRWRAASSGSRQAAARRARVRACAVRSRAQQLAGGPRRRARGRAARDLDDRLVPRRGGDRSGAPARRPGGARPRPDSTPSSTPRSRRPPARALRRTTTSAAAAPAALRSWRSPGTSARGPSGAAGAEAIAAAMLDRAAAAGDFDLPAANDPLVAADWGMMRGRTGVAWTLAQLAGVELPGLLALESPGEAERRSRRDAGDGG